jgi:transcriptional antiterminator NusG
MVEIVEGAMKGMKGKVVDVDNDQEKVVVEIDMFGRAVPSDYKVIEVKEI